MYSAPVFLRRYNNGMATTQKFLDVYSGVSKLPSGHARDVIAPGCMVLEGGAWRGIYTQGALDFYMQNDINMAATIGVSAGAMSGLSYVSGQIGRSARINLSYRHDPNYYGVPAVLQNHGITGFQFVFENVNREDPLDKAAFNDPRRRFIATATNIETGEAEYFENGKCSDIFQGIRASATVPFLSEPVEIDGKKYLDGGIACKIPVEWALQEGYEKIIVIKTQDSSYRKTSNMPEGLIRSFYHRYPRLMEDMLREMESYNALCDRIDALAEEGRIFVLAPSRPIRIDRFEKNMERLGELYWRGYHDAGASFIKLQKYLKK